MKRFFTLAVLCLLTLAPAARADEPGPDDLYFDVYTLMLKAETLEGKGRAEEARTNYADGLKILKRIQLDFPEWNPKVIKYRIGYFETRSTPPPAKPKPATAARAVTESVSAEAATPTTSTTTTGSDEPVEMKIKWLTGKRYLERLSIDVDQEVAVPGQAPQKGTVLKFTQDLALSALKDRDGGGKEVLAELLNTTVNIKAGGMEMMNFDGKQPAQGSGPAEGIAVLKKVSGSKLKFLTGADGHIESLEGIEDLVKRLAEADPTVKPEEVLKSIPPEVAGNLKAGFAKLSGLPDKPVKIGDTWSPKTETMTGLPEGSKMSFTYTFKGWEQHDKKKCALIQMTGSFNMKAGTGPQAGTPAVNARMSGKIWYDPELGTVVESTLKPDINMTMTVPGGAAGAAPTSLAMVMHVTIDVKLTQVTDIAQ